METFIVIPCLNEQEYLALTCASLGFRKNGDPIGRLILVDNGSTDETLTIMLWVRDTSPPGRVIIVQESERGYVPARRSGIAAVLKLTQVDLLPLENVLVLQADADTIYLPGYVTAMINTCSGQRGQLLEGSAVSNRDFNAQFPEFTQLCRNIDAEMEHWFAPEEDQIVIDDKVCGFLLADYYAWGEHQEGNDQNGNPVYAETTRLLMQAKRKGVVQRVRVEAAQALPSRRKLLTQAAGYFASSGFPRNQSWIMAWAQAEEARNFLTSPQTWPALEQLVQSRRRHQLALFGLLPALFQEGAIAISEVATLACSLRDDAVEMSPGWILNRMLTMADEEQGALNAILRHPNQPKT